MLRIPRAVNRTNESILQELNIECRLSTVVYERTHIMRSDSIAKSVVCLANRRRDDQQQMDRVKLSGLSLEHTIRLALGRNAWCAKVYHEKL